MIKKKNELNNIDCLSEKLAAVYINPFIIQFHLSQIFRYSII